MKKFSPVFAAALLCACTQGGTQPPSQTSTTAAPATATSVVRKALAANGITISGTLNAPAGYTGYVAQYQGRTLPVYALPDGHHLVLGTLFDLDGHNLTTTAMKGAQRDAFGEAQWQSLQSASWVAEGNPQAKRIVYTFVDTRCPYCHHLWKRSQPWLEKGNVQVRNILVGVIRAESLPEAAAILDADDPTAAWTENERNYGHNPPPKQNSSTAAIEKVRANTELMTRLGFTGTPSLIWKDGKGQIHTLRGLPRDPQALAAVFED